MSWTNEDFNNFTKTISEGKVNHIIATLKNKTVAPSGDPRLIPILEGLCADKRIAQIDIPFRYGEIAYLAAFALCAEKHKCNMEGKIRITTAVPLDENAVIELTEHHGVIIPPGISGITLAIQTLAEMGMLPQIILELDPAQDNGRIIMPEWLEPRHYDFNTEIEQLFVTLRGRDER